MRLNIRDSVDYNITSYKDTIDICEAFLQYQIVLPTSTTSFTSANISTSVPDSMHGISESTLSVPISRNNSSFSTNSPTFFLHLSSPDLSDVPSNTRDGDSKSPSGQTYFS